MERNKKIIISVVGIILVLLGLIGFTYGYYLTNIRGNTNDKSITVSLETLELTYDDGNGFIEAKDVLPGEEITTKKFTIKNTGTKKVVNYTVYLEDVVNTFADKSDLDLTLKCSSTKGTCNGNEMTFPSSNSLLVLNDIEVGEVQSYELKVVFKETNDDQTDNMQKNISGNIIIKDFRSTKQEIVKNEGTKNITLDNSILTNSLLLYGNSTQETRSGKNLIDNSMSINDYIKNESEVNMWATTVFDNQTVTSNLKSDTTYTISFDVQCVNLPEHDDEYSNGNFYGLLLYSDVSGNNSIDLRNVGFLKAGETVHISKTFTTPSTLNESTANYKILGYTNLYTLNGSYKKDGKNITSSMIFKNIQIEKGNKETSYEKYGSSPSPEFPSKITSVGDLVSDTSDANNGKYKIPVKITGKNLVSYPYPKTTKQETKTVNGITYTDNGDGSITVNGTATGDLAIALSIYTVKKGMTYYLSGCPSGGSSSTYYFHLRGYELDYGKGVKIAPTYDFTNNFEIVIKSGTTVNNLVFKPQLELGTKATEFETYHGTESNIYLDEPLRKIGDYSDYIDLKNKKVVRNIKEKTFVGTETWTYEKLSYGNNFYTNLSDSMSLDNSIVYSNKFKYNNGSLNDNYSIKLSKAKNLNLRVEAYSNATDFKNWLTSNNVKINYVLNTPTESNIDLSNIKLYDGINNITIDTSISPSKISTEYIN